MRTVIVSDDARARLFRILVFPVDESSAGLDGAEEGAFRLEGAERRSPTGSIERGHRLLGEEGGVQVVE